MKSPGDKAATLEQHRSSAMWSTKGDKSLACFLSPSCSLSAASWYDLNVCIPIIVWEYISFIPFLWLNEERPQPSIVLGYINGTFTWLTVHFIIDCSFAQFQVQKSYDPNRLAAAPLPFLLGLALFLGHPGLSYPTQPTLNDIFVPL